MIPPRLSPIPLVFFAMFALCGPAVWACTFASPPSVCEAYGMADAVFVATIEASSPNDKSQQYRVERVYKGELRAGQVAQVDNPSICGGSSLTAGERYLVYGHKLFGAGYLPGGGGRTKPLMYAGEDIAELEKMLASKPENRTYGVVYTQQTTHFAVKTHATAGTTIRMTREQDQGQFTVQSDATAQFEVESDANGHFEFPSVRAGVYRIEAIGSEKQWSRPELVTISERGCRALLLVLGPLPR